MILPQASEEFGPISYYYVVVVPDTLETKEITHPDQFSTNDVSVANFVAGIITKTCIFLFAH